MAKKKTKSRFVIVGSWDDENYESLEEAKDNCDTGDEVWEVQILKKYQCVDPGLIMKEIK